jgi:hypothetical protein
VKAQTPPALSSQHTRTHRASSIGLSGMEFEDDDDDEDLTATEWQKCFRCGINFLNHQDCPKSGETVLPCSTERSFIETDEEDGEFASDVEYDVEEYAESKKLESRPSFRRWLEDPCKHGNVHRLCFCFKAVPTSLYKKDAPKKSDYPRGEQQEEGYDDGAGVALMQVKRTCSKDLKDSHQQLLEREEEEEGEEKTTDAAKDLEKIKQEVKRRISVYEQLSENESEEERKEIHHRKRDGSVRKPHEITSSEEDYDLSDYSELEKPIAKVKSKHARQATAFTDVEDWVILKGKKMFCSDHSSELPSLQVHRSVLSSVLHKKIKPCGGCYWICDVPESQLNVFYSTMNRACCGLRDALKKEKSTKKRKEGINVYKNLTFEGVELHQMIANGSFGEKFGNTSYVE